jgi:hypothetical protein
MGVDPFPNVVKKLAQTLNKIQAFVGNATMKSYRKQWTELPICIKLFVTAIGGRFHGIEQE